MRKLSMLGLAAAALSLVAGAAQAGRTAKDANGNFLVVEVDVYPPTTSTRAVEQGVTLHYHFLFGNRTGRPVPSRRAPGAITINLPTGFKVNGGLVARCPLPKTNQELGNDRCPPGSRVGSGTGEAQIGSTFVPAQITLFNGERRKGNPTLIFRAIATLGGQRLAVEEDLEIRNPTTRPQLVTLPSPDPATAGAIPVTEVDVRVGRTVRGRPYIAASRTCKGFWTFSQTDVFDNNAGRLTATDRVACARAA
jgi:hypothetical protein